jgi:osmoprotectant transport system permease protein
MSMLIVGALLVSLLAIFADLLLQWLQRSLTSRGCSVQMTGAPSPHKAQD